MKILREARVDRLNLTLSARLIDQGYSKFLAIIKDLQQQALDSLPPQSRISTYVYPEETLHFSILNFTSFDTDIDFNSARRTTQSLEWFKNFEKVARSALVKIELEEKFSVEQFFKYEDGLIRNSISINIRPSDEWSNSLESVGDWAKRRCTNTKYRLNVSQLSLTRGCSRLTCLGFSARRILR